jgi:hypothetical protein
LARGLQLGLDRARFACGIAIAIGIRMCLIVGHRRASSVIVGHRFSRSLHTIVSASAKILRDIFDAPTREYCVVKRPRTNTPLQALALLNDPQIVEASRAFAQRIMTEGGQTPEARLAYGFRLATGRKITRDESKILLEVLNAEKAAYEKNKEGADKLLSIGSFKADAGLDRAQLAAGPGPLPVDRHGSHHQRAHHAGDDVAHSVHCRFSPVRALGPQLE